MSPFIVIAVLFLVEYVLSPEKKNRYQNAEAVMASAIFCVINALAVIITAVAAPTALSVVGWVMTALQAVVIIGCKLLVKIKNKKSKAPIPEQYVDGFPGKLVNAFYEHNKLGPGLVIKFFSEYLGISAYIAAIAIYVFFIIQNYFIGGLTGGLLPPQTGTAIISLFLEMGIFLSGESFFKALMDRYNTRKNCRSARELAAARYDYDDDYRRIFMDNYTHEYDHIIAATKQNYVDEAPKTGISFYDFKTKRTHIYESSEVNIALEEFIKSNGLEVNSLYCAAYNLIEQNKNVLIKTPSYVDFEPYLAAMINQKIAKTEKIVFVVQSAEDQLIVKKNIKRMFRDYFGFDAVPLFKTISEWHKEICANEKLQEISVSDPFRHMKKEVEEASAEPEIIKTPDVVIASPDDICDPQYIELVRAVIKRLGLIVYYNFNDCVQEEPLYAKIIHSLLDGEDTVSALYMTDGFFDFEQALDNFFSTRTIYQISVPRKAPPTSYDMIWKSENSRETQSREITDPSRNFGTHIGILFYALGFVRNDAMLVADEQDAYSENMLNYTNDAILNRIDHYVGWSNVMGGQNVMCTVSDTYNNIPHTYLSMRGIGTRSEYINIISRPYLLRKYLAHNLKFFSNEPRALSTFSSGIIRSDRALAIQAITQAFVLGFKPERLKEFAKFFKLDEELSPKDILLGIANIAFDGEIEATVIYDGEETERYFVDEKTYTAILSESNLLRKIYFHINGEVFVRPYRDYQYIIPHQKIVLNGTKYTVLSVDGDNVELTNSNNRDPIFTTRVIRNIKATVKSSESYGKQYQHGNEAGGAGALSESFIDFTHMVCDTEINILGRISFADKYSLLSDDVRYTFSSIDDVPGKKYKNVNLFKIRIGSKYINASNKNELARFMALLLNEMLPTFFPKHSDKIMVSCSGWGIDKSLRNEEVGPRHIVTQLDINDPDPVKDNEICIYISEDSAVETGIINVFWQDEEFRYMLKILEDYLYFIEYIDRDERLSVYGRKNDNLIHTLRKTLLVAINEIPDFEDTVVPMCVNPIRRTRNKFYTLDLTRKYNLVCDCCGKPIVATPHGKNEYHYYSYSGRVSCNECYTNAVSADRYTVLAIKEIEKTIRNWLTKKYGATINGEFYNYLEDAAYINRGQKRRFIIWDDEDYGLRAAGYASPGKSLDVDKNNEADDEYLRNMIYDTNDEDIGCNLMDKENADIYDVERTSYRVEADLKRHILISDGFSRDFYNGCLCHELVHQWQFENLDFDKMRENIPSGGYDEFGMEVKLTPFRYEGHAAWTEVQYLESTGKKGMADRRRRGFLSCNDEYGFGYRWLSDLMHPGAIDPYSPKAIHTPAFRRSLLACQLKGDAFGVMMLYFGKTQPPAAASDEIDSDESATAEGETDVQPTEGDTSQDGAATEEATV